ncbi:MAG: hypothetical protein LBD46_06500 [Endomicrobium sp.]|jgi:hypothetical protein|nr:hypothetical protein [Endomicrobium sp.]
MTPKQQYKIFWNKFIYFFNFFNLARWELRDKGICAKADDKKCAENGGALVLCDIEQRTCTVSFFPLKNIKNKKEKTEELEALAFHEALHVLLMPLGRNIAFQHEIINVLVAYHRIYCKKNSV